MLGSYLVGAGASRVVVPAQANRHFCLFAGLRCVESKLSLYACLQGCAALNQS
jgi:hypothetical protein